MTGIIADDGAAASPFFSIVVPVHNVRAYLRACLDSILGQSYADFEVIAIDDASPDGSGEILDGYAAADSRVQVVHLEQNVGLGRARDVGVDLARGTYLLFVDSDDELTPGALEAIASRLGETGRPDILIFDYARTFWTGRVTRNMLADSLGGAVSSGVFTARDHPELLELLMVVWNKAYRRDFVTEQGFRFPPGYYEDLPWTYPSLLAARGIAVLDRVCYHYRQRRHGNILGSQNRRHFDVFDQYDLVLGFVDAHPDLQSWRPFLFQRMIDHLLVILAAEDRVTSSMRKEFFVRLCAAYRQYKPEGYEPPAGLPGLKTRAVARGDYAGFEAIRLGGQVIRDGKKRIATARKTGKVRMIAGKRALIHAMYRAEQRKPVDENLAVYSAYWSNSYSCNPAAIYEQAKRIAPHVRGVWVIKKQFVDRIPPGVEYVELNSPEYYKVVARAKYFVNNVNFSDNVVKRPGMVHLQTQHGTPLKKMGVDLRDFPVGAAGMSFWKLLERCDRWDYLVSANRFSTQIWERSYPCAYITLETGYPRNDRLVRSTPDERTSMRARLNLPEGKIAVLYTPTFRDWSRRNFDPPVDLADLCERLGPDYVVLVRAHYFTGGNERLTSLERAGLLRDVSEYPTIEDLMIASDLLLTDYSSIMFDYATLDRPIVVYAQDWDTYVRVRGVNFDLLETPPGAVAMTQDELVDTLVSGRWRGEEAELARAEFHKRFNEFEDGHAAERVVRRVFLGEMPSLGSQALLATGVDQGRPEPVGGPAIVTAPAAQAAYSAQAGGAGTRLLDRARGDDEDGGLDAADAAYDRREGADGAERDDLAGTALDGNDLSAAESADRDGDDSADDDTARESGRRDEEPPIE